jgi:L-ascorbate metabolism protein UlaG (beta-lactamase superfamily)
LLESCYPLDYNVARRFGPRNVIGHLRKIKEIAMSIKIEWLGHASFRISCEVTLYIDPWKIQDNPHDADLILISHDHFDHYVAEDVAKVAKKETQIVATADVIAKHGAGETIAPGEQKELENIKIVATSAYNIDKEFHPQKNNWVGFIIELNDKRIYFAGDTDHIPEMHSIKHIDLAMMPVGGTYTLTGAEAAVAVNQIQPKKALPYHWGDIVGELSDAESFSAEARCEVIILKPGEHLIL